MQEARRVQVEREGLDANGDLATPGKESHLAVQGGPDAPTAGGDYQGGGRLRGDSPQRAGAREGGGGGAGLGTPAATREARGAGEGMNSASSTPRGATRPQGLLQEGSPLRGVARSTRAPGLQTFGAKYMPFAAGFDRMAGEMPVYRSSRLHSINPTAAINEDTSYLYTLDSGLETPATRAANPDRPHSEHVRNTRAGTGGGLMGKLFGPIR